MAIFLAVPSLPLNISLSSIAGSPSQLSASWSVPIPRNGIITGYSVYCNTSANQTYPEQVIGPNEPTIRSVVNGTTLAATLSGLSPYTQYSCYVTANTSVGEGSPSFVFTTITVQSGNLLCYYAVVYNPKSMKHDLPNFASSINFTNKSSLFICSSNDTSKLLTVSCCWFTNSAVC